MEYIFYDSSYKDRSPTQKFINNLSRLEELGESVTDDKLEQVKSQVKPEFIVQHQCTSVWISFNFYKYIWQELLRISIRIIVLK